MSILIKSMEMPKDCNSCRFSGFGGLRNERIVCMFTGSNDYLNQQERFSDCPLVEVPPHGRLIDFNAIPWENQTMTYDDEWAIKAFDLEQMPTIIEAEEET